MCTSIIIYIYIYRYILSLGFEAVWSGTNLQVRISLITVSFYPPSFHAYPIYPAYSSFYLSFMRQGAWASATWGRWEPRSWHHSGEQGPGRPRPQQTTSSTWLPSKIRLANFELLGWLFNSHKPIKNPSGSFGKWWTDETWIKDDTRMYIHDYTCIYKWNPCATYQYLSHISNMDVWCWTIHHVHEKGPRAPTVSMSMIGPLLFSVHLR